MPFPLERWQLVEDTLFNLITNAAQSGGMLPLVKRVGRVAVPKRGLFPYAGVQFLRFTERKMGAQGVHFMVYTYAVSVIVPQPFDPSQPDTEANALANLTQYINDGTGNGMSVLLSSQPQIAGSVSSYISSLQRGLGEGVGDQAGAVAMAVWDYNVEDEVVRF